MGFDPIWLGVTSTVACCIGMITPPVGMNLFVLKGAVPGLTLETVIKGAVPTVLVLALGLVILSVFPILSTWLPSTM
jgi:TRAP-type C4-dicarboxylate transport system permease large subunit